ncbi:DNA polymerase III subunit alpha [Sneathiella chungangensis]|uniref:Error-prone DNA polymerase n=2 Tax=Sneathiella chungangensis TaxID=1418234 RepID=A0A845MDI9_9PROT|nr:DNA polymerase III subunit alpha [Sneathiella chungangensis]
MTPPAYAELQVTTNFTFLEGASHPDEMVLAAAARGLSAIAITDRNSFAGIVRAHSAARDARIRLIIGVRVDFMDGRSLLAYPEDRAAYGRLCRLLTLGRRRAPKGECHLTLEDFLVYAEGQVVALLPPERIDSGFEHWVETVRAAVDGTCYLVAHHLYRGDDVTRIAILAALAARKNLTLLATNDVHAHVVARRPLQDVLTCIREGCRIETAGTRLFMNAERHIKSPAEMAALFVDWPGALAAGLEIADRCRFSLDELKYEYPTGGYGDHDPQAELVRLVWLGAADRFPDGVPEAVVKTLTHEINLVAELKFAPYFLTVNDIVRFARSQGILCQGRGSAANSAICFCLGITSIDPVKSELLFERFISAERGEPPDIDVDFEHERREEVIQYIYAKYGRDRAGLAATVISFRTKMAIREVGKALGLSLDTITLLAKSLWRSKDEEIQEKQIREAGLDPEAPNIRFALELTRELAGFPRHLSQHVGGFVITEGPLEELVPIENAAMEERTVVQWDKDDLDALGILKIDVLGLGMLSCIRKAFDLLKIHYGLTYDLATMPQEDPRVYDMLCRADSIGVFQVESRAQMSMLPRLKPRNFYDLVIEVAIVRPGPIQGDMVHPYLRRRDGKETPNYPSKELQQVLQKTLGVPLFQEQAMKIAIVAAGFTPSEADQLRRAMATFRKMGTIGNFEEKMVEGMVARGYEREFAERCFKQIEGFGDYGFPESHAASFALLVYASAWLKYAYPAAFAAALLNSQPMGFYASAQIIRDARDHHVQVFNIDVNYSVWDNVLEAAHAVVGTPKKALRLGFRQIKGFKEVDAEALEAARGKGYLSIRDLWRRSGLDAAALERLAEADAFHSLGLSRRAALWEARALGDYELPLFAHAESKFRPGVNQVGFTPVKEPQVILPAPKLAEDVMLDYERLRLSLKAHPMELFRSDLAKAGMITAKRLEYVENGKKVRVAGLVLNRQRPGTAKGVIFATLEDETGWVNLVIWQKTFEKYRRIILGSRLLAVEGEVQKEGIVIHVVVKKAFDMGSKLSDLLENPETPLALPEGRNFR